MRSGRALVVVFVLLSAFNSHLFFQHATADDWRSFPSNINFETESSVYSTISRPEDAIDGNLETFSILEANRCDGGTDNCQEISPGVYPFSQIELTIPVLENTTAIKLFLQPMLYEGSEPPNGSVAAIECDINAPDGGIYNYEAWMTNSTQRWDDNNLGWTDFFDWSEMYSRAITIPVGQKPTWEKCSKDDEGAVTFRIYTKHEGESYDSDETAIYLFEIMEVCEGESCHTPCEERDFGFGEDAADYYENALGIEISLGKNKFNGYISKGGLDNDEWDFVRIFIPLGHIVTIQLTGIELHGEHNGDCPISVGGNDFDLVLMEWQNSVALLTSTGWTYPETITTNLSTAGRQMVIGINSFEGSGPYDLSIWLMQTEILPEDSDNDSWTNEQEIECGADPYNNASYPNDYDLDGYCDEIDLDDDNDGISDILDYFPFDPTEWIDSDSDGVGDNADLDDDGDGWSDDAENGCLTDSKNNSEHPIEIDESGNCILVEDENTTLDEESQSYESNCDVISAGTSNNGYGYIISYETDESIEPAKLYYDNQYSKDWDMDGFNNSVDFYPTDITRAVMSVCGTNFGYLSSEYSFTINMGSLSSIDGMVITDWDKDGDTDIIAGGTSSLSEYRGIIMGIENINLSIRAGASIKDTFAKPVNMKNLGHDFRFFDPELTGDVDDIALYSPSGDPSQLGLIVGTGGWTRYYAQNTLNWSELSFIIQDENPWADDVMESQRAKDIIVADMNNDGLLDWVINYRSTEIYEDGWEPRFEVFDYASTSGRPSGLKIESGEVKYHINWVDWNSDGALEILACKYSCDIFSPLTGERLWTWGGGNGPIWSSAYADYDKDGDYELAIGTKNSIQIYDVDINGELGAYPEVILDNQHSRHLHWGDIDGNGWLDLISGNNGRDKIFGNFEGDLELVWIASSNANTNFLFASDIDLDGDYDLVGSNYDEIFVILNERDEQASDRLAIKIIQTPVAVTSGLLFLIALARCLFMMAGKQSDFLPFGLGFFVVILLIQSPLLFGHGNTVEQCGFNEACVANVIVDSHWLFDSNYNDLTFMDLEEKDYDSFSGNILAPFIFLDICLIYLFVKHFFKTNGNFTTQSERDTHVLNTSNSITGLPVFAIVGIWSNPGFGDAEFWDFWYFLDMCCVCILPLTILLFVSTRKKGLLYDYVDSRIPTVSQANSKSLSKYHAKAFTNKKKAKPKRKSTHVRMVNGQKVTGGLENFHTVIEMKSALRKIGSTTSGNKSELAERLYNDLKELQNKLMQNYDPPRHRMYAEAYSDLASGIPPEPDGLAKLYSASAAQSQTPTDSDPEQITTVAMEDIDDKTQDYSQIQTSNSDTNSEAYLEKETAREQFENNTWKNNMDTKIVHETKFSEIRKTTLKLQNDPFRALIIKTPKTGYEKMLEREINTTRTITKNKISTRYTGDTKDNVGPTIFFSRAGKSPILVLEEIGDKDISSIENFSNMEKMECLMKVAEDISSLHKIGWVHRDIKPKNIMMKREMASDPVLIDFGSALRINKKQGGIVGGQTKTEFYGHITQEKAEERAHPGQDWFGFSRTCLELILVENNQTLTSMIMGGSIENKISQFFKNNVNLDNWPERLLDGNLTQTRMEALKELLIYSTTIEAESAAGLERLLVIGQRILE